MNSPRQPRSFYLCHNVYVSDSAGNAYKQNINVITSFTADHPKAAAYDEDAATQADYCGAVAPFTKIPSIGLWPWQHDGTSGQHAAWKTDDSCKDMTVTLTLALTLALRLPRPPAAPNFNPNRNSNPTQGYDSLEQLLLLDA